MPYILMGLNYAMSEKERRIKIKSVLNASQEERRNARLRDQRDARRGLQERNRFKLEVWDFSEEEVHDVTDKMLTTEVESEILSCPEYMLEVPTALEDDWLCLAQPKGQRCLVRTEHGGIATSYRFDGTVLHEFKSALPPGTALECIFDEYSPDQIYWALDMIEWKYQNLHETEFEFRTYWLHTKLSEVSASHATERNTIRIIPLVTYLCQRDHLLLAYQKAQVIGNGILFLHKEGHYAVGKTPLALIWKDESCSSTYSDSEHASAHESLVPIIDDTTFFSEDVHASRRTNTIESGGRIEFLSALTSDAQSLGSSSNKSRPATISFPHLLSVLHS